jgi:hypothetical protein
MDITQRVEKARLDVQQRLEEVLLVTPQRAAVMALEIERLMREVVRQELARA